MKRSLTVTIALVMVGICASLMRSDSRVEAANQIRVIANTGVVSLGPDQVLRIAVDPSDPSGNTYLRFRQIDYTQGTCTGGACKQTVASQTTSEPMTLLPGEAVWVDLDRTPGSSAVRAVVMSSGRDARINIMIIDTTTGAIVSVLSGWPTANGTFN